MAECDRGASNLPPSCKYVLSTLEDHGPTLTRQELLAQTNLPERTLQDALDTLENRNLILRSRKTDDLTQVECELCNSTDL
jgi:uncharacterized membrane protein